MLVYKKLQLSTIIFLSISVSLFFYLKNKTRNSLQIELLDETVPLSETAQWKGKKTDWLGKTYDVNNSGNEVDKESMRIVSSTGWLVPKDPYLITKGELEQVVMDEGNGWDSDGYSYPEAKGSLEKSDLTDFQKQYFYDHNYIPRSIEHFDVTGDGIKETVTTSLTLGCGRCVDFYMSIFTNDSIYNVRASEGTIIETEDGNGFYLVDYFGGGSGATIDIRKYIWDKSNSFVEIAIKKLKLQE